MAIPETLTQKRDAAVQTLSEWQEQHRRLGINIERLIGRISTLNELIQEAATPAPTEGQGEPDQ
jgi:hypothetical protein